MEDNQEDVNTYFHIIPAAKNGDIYIQAESYPLKVVDTACHGGSYTFNSETYTNVGNSVAVVMIYINSNLHDYVWVDNKYGTSFLIQESEYASGDIIKVNVMFFWVDSPVRDFTLWAYANQALDVLDSNGNSN